MRQGKKNELAEEYKVLASQPATAESLYDAGLVASKIGRPRDADTAWARLRKDFPDHPLSGRVSLEMAQSAFAKNSYKDASTLARAASRSPEDAVRGEAFVLLGESELKQRRHAAAITAFKSAAEAPALEPAMRFRALAGTGLAHEEQKQYGRGREALRGGRDQEPGQDARVLGEGAARRRQRGGPVRGPARGQGHAQEGGAREDRAQEGAAGGTK